MSALPPSSAAPAIPRRRCLAAFVLAAWPGAPRAATPRVVSLGGTVTEIVAALDAFDRVVGVDASSLYPPAATSLPQVGYYRSFSVEGVASLRPDLVLASAHAGPPRALAQLRALGIEVVAVPAEPAVPALQAAIGRVAEALALGARGRALIAQVQADIAQAQGQRPAGAAVVPVLVLSRHTGRLQAAGAGTAAHAIVTLAGGGNLFAARQGYKEIGPEAIAMLAPQAIVTTERSIGASGSLAGFAAQPGVATTPAARHGRIAVVDDLLLLGFGPRIGLALQRLQPLFGPARAEAPQGRRASAQAHAARKVAP